MDKQREKMNCVEICNGKSNLLWNINTRKQYEVNFVCSIGLNCFRSEQ